MSVFALQIKFFLTFCVSEKCPIQAGNPVLSDPIQLFPNNTALPPNDFQFTCTVMYPNPVNGLEKFQVTHVFLNALPIH